MEQSSSPKLKLHNFKWKGINSSGKKVSGQFLAFTEIEVRDKLRTQQIQIKKVRKSGISLLDKLSHKVKKKDIMVFTRQMATMLGTGVPIVQSLKMVSDNHNKAEMKSILSQISKAVEAGTPISKALSTSSSHFDNFYTDLIETGEQTGNLSEVFDRIATYQEKSEQLRSKVIKAMIYPVMVILTAIGVSFLMLKFVIPEFEKMFSSFGAELPWFTQQVLKLSHIVQNDAWKMALALVVFTVGFKLLRKRSFKFRLRSSRWGLKFPIVGGVFSKAAIAKFSRTLATSFNAGIPILNGLKTSAKTASNLHYQVAIEQVYKDTAAGMPIYIAMRNTEAFPEMVLQMVMIGEESGSLDDMLNKVANVYEFEVDNTVDNLGKLLEPLIIVFLGVVIGGLVVSMYLPVFNLMSVLG
ncbi:Type IV pilin assembly protein pilC [Vibrio nigripulchritudo SFn27]|uniref:Type IV pilin assembly protein pilC n=1 Tax=Vibrio nigripulchritudo TaxID=28173 RepID=U4K1H2_9VIBR|nr:type II secretion system F family protein [Vibrio nigripulchritudo]CCN84661.1 Type IV pilin assembly protein pilC [Vibrio nigripulchritudo BLFn1]CCN86848.1 Type IV pilin assembly protein pilC [Vibrio nigripulchritudo SFn27]CCN93114.1 Type IV pilin assembly protein pilC [Vibrio nigripulchritudo ENn2]CCO42126.1 Type IV pilin assembly protein pilC [Vibrio nigripulchritudo SFn135]CCO53750.1 Type IV pilin assembly protein pilC [Vibrio nigripulchritudo Wn13]